MVPPEFLHDRPSFRIVEAALDEAADDAKLVKLASHLDTIEERLT
jgi:hypothetical protein